MFKSKKKKFNYMIVSCTSEFSKFYCISCSTYFIIGGGGFGHMIYN